MYKSTELTINIKIFIIAVWIAKKRMGMTLLLYDQCFLFLFSLPEQPSPCNKTFQSNIWDSFPGDREQSNNNMLKFIISSCLSCC